MRKSVLATAAVPLAVLAFGAMPAAADTVVKRETVIIRDAPTRLVERRYYRAPTVRYYAAQRTTYVAPRRHYYTSAPADYYAPATRYRYTSTYYYNAPNAYYSAPAYDYDSAGYYYDTPGYTYASTLNGCDALYRRAVATGSGYWWDRYSECE